jgi:hypothetical protein
MKSRLHVLGLVLFAVSLFYNAVVWGGVADLGDVGTALSDSAHREAPLATTYIAIGSVIDRIMPSLRAFGASRLRDALGDGFDRLRANPQIGMDLALGSTSLNATHRVLKGMYWSTPVFLLFALLFWARRPKHLRTLGSR